MIELGLQRVDSADLRVTQLFQEFQSFMNRDKLGAGVGGRRRRTWGTSPFANDDLVDPLTPIHARVET